MVFHVVLECLIIVVLDFLLGDATRHLLVLVVGLVGVWLALHARHAVLLGVESQLRMATF